MKMTTQARDAALAPWVKAEVTEAWSFYLQRHPVCLVVDCQSPKMMFSLMCPHHTVRTLAGAGLFPESHGA